MNKTTPGPCFPTLTAAEFAEYQNLRALNAELVAALKRACDHLIMSGTKCNDAPDALAQARAALAKAQGGENV